MYDRAPIVVTPNICALPERGGRKFIGSNSNQGGLGYFHPHAKFQVNTVRDSTETVSPTIFSASVTVGNINDCGSVDLFMKKRSGPMYDYDYDYDQYSRYDQHTQHAEQVVSSLLFDHSLDSSDLGVFYTPPPRIPTPPSSSSLCVSPRLMYDTSTSTPSPSLPSSNNNNTASHSDEIQEKKKSSLDVGRKKRGKNRAEGVCRIMLRRPSTSDSYISPSVELEGCLGGF